MVDTAVNVIDIHQHIGLGHHEADLMVVPSRDEFSSWSDLALAHCEAKDRYRALLPPTFYQTAAGINDVRRLNDLMDLLSTRKDRGVVGSFGIVEPHHGSAALDEIGRIAKSNLKGIVFSPRTQGVYADTPEIIALTQHAGEHGLTVMIHATAASSNEPLWRIWNLATSCKDVSMVALGAFASWDNIQAILANPDTAPNLKYDTAGLHALPISFVTQKLGADRLLYGSGAHDTAAAGGLSSGSLPPFEDLESELRHRILYRNAEHFLNLSAG